ncbi:MAG: hypothetical protein KJ676_12595 [Alphaproteobacteria bacterium]|nr:hypothetical protein [Alphaproteobacteria bacterium]MBU1525327.1 hypothetical protein [Alphaproteobacteria bacterium]MBU2116880.1 hypothetical protein [Alphaproteobacteria bacterium]MBU2352282.1 hypothetical protein [Alphaproteobacteria bacterium]MBU2381640.1 hypothetical protein [Alphaproteobacteria bacterium]
MFKVLIPAAATLALVAFAAQSRSEPVVDAPASGTPTPEATLAWHLSHEGGMAKLAYGVAHSDQIVIMLTCRPGDARAQAFGVVTPAGVAVVDGPAPVDPLTGLAMADVAVDMGSSALTSLRAGGRLPVVGEAGRADLPVTPGDKAVIDGFFAHCGATRA